MDLIIEEATLLEKDHFAFIGIIATLTVLSVLPFTKEKNEERMLSNFLIDLIRTYKWSLDEAFEEKLKKANIMRDGEMDKKLDALRLEIMNAHKEAVKKSKSFTHIENSTPAFMSFFTFILCVAIMFIHCWYFRTDINAYFLFLFDVLSSVVMLACWICYFIDWIKPENERYSKVAFFNGNKEPKKWIWVANAIAFCIFAFAFLMFRIGKIAILCIFIFLTALGICSYINRLNRAKHYDNGTVALMAAIGFLSAFFLSLLMCLTTNYSCFYDWFSGYSWCRDKFLVINENLLYINDHIRLWGKGFLFLSLLNSFILPIGISYIRYDVIRDVRLKKNMKSWNERLELIEKYNDQEEDD